MPHEARVGGAWEHWLATRQRLGDDRGNDSVREDQELEEDERRECRHKRGGSQALTCGGLPEEVICRVMWMLLRVAGGYDALPRKLVKDRPEKDHVAENR